MDVKRQLIFAMMRDAIDYTVGGRFGECDVEDVVKLYSELKKCFNEEALRDFELFIKD